MSDIYEELSNERKDLQKRGLVPDWMTTGGWQAFKDQNKHMGDGYFEQIDMIGTHLSQYPKTDIPEEWKDIGETWEEAFHNITRKGWLVYSTPVLSHCGTNKGCSVSCSGGEISDSVKGFFDAYIEAALLTKEGFGTSYSLNKIRGRGTPISRGGHASGSLHVMKRLSQDARDISQGNVRRGAVAMYLDLMHEDFDEWADHLHKNPEGLNIGWNIHKVDIQNLIRGEKETTRRWMKCLWVKAQSGKGYFWKIDTVNEAQPECYTTHGLSNKASNLCTEIVGHSDEDHTYSCVLSSPNMYFYDDWKDTSFLQVATVLLDCVAEDFIQRGRDIVGLERVVRFTEKARMLGLGTLGFHSYLQKHMVAFESFEANSINHEYFKNLEEKSIEASKWMAKEWGEPEWCKGTGRRNTHNIAIAPNMGSATIAGQRSQGIEPIIANVFMQDTPSGAMRRINPEFLALAESRGKNTKPMLRSVLENKGSVQHLDWLTDHEKLVFRTAFEIDQKVILRLASQRQRYIDQAQSLNLFFDADEREEYIAEVHAEFLIDPRLKSLYYMRTLAGVQAAKDECIACEG